MRNFILVECSNEAAAIW